MTVTRLPSTELTKSAKLHRHCERAGSGCCLARISSGHRAFRDDAELRVGRRDRSHQRAVIRAPDPDLVAVAWWAELRVMRIMRLAVWGDRAVSMAQHLGVRDVSVCRGGWRHRFALFTLAFLIAALALAACSGSDDAPDSAADTVPASTTDQSASQDAAQDAAQEEEAPPEPPLVQRPPELNFTAAAVWGRGDGIVFEAPNHLDVGPDGNIYLTEFRGGRVFKFSPDGGILAQWGAYRHRR